MFKVSPPGSTFASIVHNKVLPIVGSTIVGSASDCRKQEPQPIAMALADRGGAYRKGRVSGIRVCLLQLDESLRARAFGYGARALLQGTSNYGQERCKQGGSTLERVLLRAVLFSWYQDM